MRDTESRDLAGAAHFAAADAEPEPPPDPSEYEEDPGLYACATCGEAVRHYGQRCDRCKRNMEEDRLERESGR